MKVDTADIEETDESPLTDIDDLRAQIEKLCAFMGPLTCVF